MRPKKTLSGGKGGVGGVFSAISTPFRKAAVRSILESQGFGKMPAEKVIDKGLLDLQCVENCLGLYGEGPFFMGLQLSVIDVIIFSFVVPFFKLEAGWKLSRLFVSINPQAYPKLYTLCDAIYNRVVTLEGPETQTSLHSSISQEEKRELYDDKHKVKETIVTTVKEPNVVETTYVMKERIEREGDKKLDTL